MKSVWRPIKTLAAFWLAPVSGRLSSKSSRHFGFRVFSQVHILLEVVVGVVTLAAVTCSALQLAFVALQS
jgi:hypothetical protein